jgi:uncharacterized protein (DUF4415 family)
MSGSTACRSLMQPACSLMITVLSGSTQERIMAKTGGSRLGLWTVGKLRSCIPLAAKRSVADGDIDFSDLPPQIGVSWTRPGALVPTANKRSITLRLDEDVLAFFKSTGKRYQTRINAVLRAYMKAHDGKGGNVE